jgi:hypothetical protein
MLPLSGTLRYYIDDSGSRRPDRDLRTDSARPDWFGLGGVIVNEADVPAIEARVRQFREKWPHPQAPLHSSEIRQMRDGFAWLKTVSRSRRDTFLGEIGELLCELPLVVHATVIDRPGYNRRYMELYEDGRWYLCKTAFNIAVERAAKYALHRQSRLRVYVERSSPQDEKRLKGYYEHLLVKGQPFDAESSAKYGPLGEVDFAATLLEFAVRTKRSTLMQLADICLWPVCKGRYDPSNIAFSQLVGRGKLLDALCTPENQLHGIKYSCFDA